ncbi:PQQ-dependent sugar dehydrogenase [Phaeovulum sp. W22_SRMD_FR3]|uniref:PQQ-dependent sugar dehydrogenase n=1 Tax=Phaeovulum sp. W22_SRMD_FR3 TaxID=3240274 RepID=UPI003F9C3463
MSGRSFTVTAGLMAACVVSLPAAQAESINAGGRAARDTAPFQSQKVAAFDTPWALAFLPDGRLLVTEKPGGAYLVGQDGAKTKLAGVPDVAASGQNGLLDVAVAPDFAQSGHVYLTYVEPAAEGTRLALARATLVAEEGAARLADLSVIWRQTPAGGRGQPGGIIAFDPAGQHLFLTVGDRMEPETAQDPDMARGKVLRLTLDGGIPADNPMAGEGGVRAQTWTTGHRNPYGLAFAADGRLWAHEMGPRGGDEFNLLKAGENYGWPRVSNGDNYSGTAIPDHATDPEFAAPAVYWTPVIAPAGLAFYQGDMFPAWQGSALIGGLAATSLVRVSVGAGNAADEAERWEMGARIRDVAVAPDGAVWVIEDADPGALLRLTPTP